MVRVLTEILWRKKENEMSDMQRLDVCSGVSSQERWIAPPSLPVCEPAQVQHGGKNCWPFLYSYRGDTLVVNATPKKTNYQQATEIGDALL
jgi:hypothetical protein